MKGREEGEGEGQGEGEGIVEERSGVSSMRWSEGRSGTVRCVVRVLLHEQFTCPSQAVNRRLVQ